MLLAAALLFDIRLELLSSRGSHSPGAPTWSWVWGGQMREKIEPPQVSEFGGTVLPLWEELATGGMQMEIFPNRRPPQSPPKPLLGGTVAFLKLYS